MSRSVAVSPPTERSERILSATARGSQGPLTRNSCCQNMNPSFMSDSCLRSTRLQRTCAIGTFSVVHDAPIQSPMRAAQSDPHGQPQSAVTAAAKRQRYDRLAPFYDLIDLPFEYHRYRTMRPQLFAGISGIILDAGVGTGRNLPFYPEGSRVIGIDSSPGMIARARKRRDELGKDVELREMNVLATAFPDQHFDAIVATFLF
ncbi:MAG: class I SAM-dependent methyltransferase [Gammaproteobacteria bacterium]|nr:MAG: class I SAM-dependent methyltransferase [Gammaproteobacteria bacterium]